MKKSVVREKSFDFAIRVVNLYKYLNNQKEFVLSKQLLRAGTSVGAMVHEADFGESKADFIHKMAIAQKECNEAIYWLELLFETEYLTQEQFHSLNEDAVELIKLLTAIIVKAKKNNQ